MTTDEQTSDTGAPTFEPAAPQTTATESVDEKDLNKNLLLQVWIVGGIVFLLAVAAFFGAF